MAPREMACAALLLRSILFVLTYTHGYMDPGTPRF